MDLDEGSLKLIDPENLTILNTQPIHTIRVWGVGRDNGRLVNNYFNKYILYKRLLPISTLNCKFVH